MNVEHLPAWANYNEDKKIIVVDPDVVYPLYLAKLGYDVDSPTQAQLETARLCMTEDLHRLVGQKLILQILKSPDNKWRLTNFPPGTPIAWMREYERISQKAG